MKNRRLTILGIAMVLLVSSCRKNDFLAPETAAAPTTVTSDDWKAAPAWSATESEGRTTHSFSMADGRVTEDVAANGLVIGFKKMGKGVVVLPAEEKTATGSYFWYYQVADGNIEISADALNGAKAPAADNSFKFIVFTSEQLASLSEKGYGVSRLMQLSYEELSAL